MASRLRLQSAHDGGDEVMLITPLKQPAKFSQPPLAVFSAGYLWGHAGNVAAGEGLLVASNNTHSLRIFPTAGTVSSVHVPLMGPSLAEAMSGPVGISTGHRRSLAEVQAVLERQRNALLQRTHGTPANTSSIRQAIETTLAWDTIYEPEKQRVLSPVSRIWNENWGGYVVFDWDTFFAGTLSAIDDRNLAYANTMEVLNEATSQGFVPNYARAGGWKSSDRSEPPVGAITVLALYQQFHDKWFLEQTFDGLLRWNTWWVEHRDLGGYLVVGQ